MSFGSDNWAGAHPSITASLSAHAPGFDTPYGEGGLDSAVARRFSEVFEKEVAVFYAATGTAANCLALASVAVPGGVVLAHREAHVVVDECGAPEFLSGGQMRVVGVGGEQGKIDVGELRGVIKGIGTGNVHGGRVAAVSVTQPTEAGSVYGLGELDAIAEVARGLGVPLHMDGARFANGLVALGCSPAEMTWMRGVDLLSFGATKNGCWCAEAVVVFDPAKAADVPWIRKRSGQLLSKTRFVSAQFEAYLAGGLWLELARHSNGMAGVLAGVLLGAKWEGVRLLREPQGNEVFAVVKRGMVAKLQERGVTFFAGWPAPVGVAIGEDEELCRFVTSFATTKEDVELVRASLA